MVAARKIHGGAVAEAPVPAVDLGQVLESRSEVIANWWRRKYYDSNSSAGVGQIEGILEHLISEIGRSVQTELDLPVASWGRTQGILRLSMRAGPEGLNREFDLLRVALEQVAEQLRAPAEQRKRMRVILDTCQAAALAQMRVAKGMAGTVRQVPFGGVVTETV